MIHFPLISLLGPLCVGRNIFQIKNETQFVRFAITLVKFPRKWPFPLPILLLLFAKFISVSISLSWFFYTGGDFLFCFLYVRLHCARPFCFQFLVYSVCVDNDSCCGPLPNDLKVFVLRKENVEIASKKLPNALQSLRFNINFQALFALCLKNIPWLSCTCKCYKIDCYII